MQRLFAIRDQQPLMGHIIALLSGAILPLALAPFNFWPVAIMSLTAFLFTLDVKSSRTIVLRYYLFSVGMYGVGVSWIFVSINVYGGASYLLAAFLVLFFVLSYSLTSLVAAFIHVNVSNRLIAFPAIWVFLEWFRSWFLTGFPWLYVGYSHLDSPLAGYVPIWGVFGLSFLTALSAALLVGLRRNNWPIHLILLGAIWGAGSFIAAKLNWVESTGQVASVAAVQGNIEQHTKWRRESVGPILKTYVDLTEDVWGRDIIVWPEAAITLFRENASVVLDELSNRGKENGSTLVLGIPDRDSEGRFLNAAIAVGDGAGAYQKRQLVPFGEYVPLENLLRGLITFFDLPMSHNRAGPDDQEPLLAGDWRLSLSICYEVVYPELVRQTVDLPDLLVTISNDTWFGESIGPKQHLQMARMRAAENGRDMIRATNNGVTALIDHRGRIKNELAPNAPGVLIGELSIMKGETPYHRFGHWPVLAFSLLILAILAGKRYFVRD